jgi:hypothetical protein
MATTGKNEPCPCKSGRTYEDCCLIRDVLPAGRMDAKEFSKAVLAVLENRKFKSQAEAQAFIDKLTQARNVAPLEDFSGASSEQMYHFLHRPFDSPGLITYNLGIKQFPDSPFLRLFFLLMNGVVKEDLKTTTQGNLPVKFVQAAAEQYYGEEEYGKLRRYNSLRTETYFSALHTVRVLAEMSGFVRKNKKQFHATKEGKRVAEHGMDGAAFFALFQAYTRKFNWAYDDRYPDLPMIQESFLFSLYLLSQHGGSPRPASFYGNLFLKAFPVALEETPERAYASREDTLLSCYALRSFARFGHFFGFVDIAGDEKERWVEKKTVKKTPFLDEWIRFTIT